MDLVFPSSLVHHELYLPLLPHAYAAIVYRPPNTALTSLQIWASLTEKTGGYTMHTDSLNTTEKLYRISAEAYTICLGPSSSPSLNILSRRGCILEMLNRFSEAETLQRHVLSLRTKSLGREHTDTLATSDHLALVLAQQSHFDKAEALYLDTLEVRSRTLGDGHEATQNSLSDLVHFYLRHSRLTDAYAMSRRAHENRPLANLTSSENRADPQYYKNLTGIALSHLLRVASSSAEKCLREALTEREKGGEGGDPYLTQILFHLARSLAEQGKDSEAASFLQRAMSLFTTHQTPERLAASTELATVLLKLDRLDEAHDVAAGCLAERSDLNGATDRDAYEVMWVLASVLEKQGKWEEAVEMYRKACEGTSEVLGEDHVDTKEFDRDYRALVERMEGRKAVESDREILHKGRDGCEEDTIAGAEDNEREMIADGKVVYVAGADRVPGRCMRRYLRRS